MAMNSNNHNNTKLFNGNRNIYTHSQKNSFSVARCPSQRMKATHRNKPITTKKRRKKKSKQSRSETNDREWALKRTYGIYIDIK